MKLKYALMYFIGIVMASVLHANTNPQVEMLPVNVDLHDKESLQRGARLFMNYCSGCHSLRYMRYNKMGQDLGLTTFDGVLDNDLLVSNLIFTQVPVYSPIEISMPAVDSREWFGVVPPDLSLSARKRGASWIYTYLKSFYEDKKRPFGANNLLIPGVAMPNVLAPLSGRVVGVSQNPQDKNLPVSHLLRVNEGEMTAQEFDSAVEDLVTFLVYVGSPEEIVRHRIGGFVIAFFLIFLLVAYRLKRSYWKNIH